MENKLLQKVRKGNALIDGRYRFGLSEQKILLSIISKIRFDDKELKPYRLSWNDLKKLSQGYLDTTKKIDEACEKLKNKTIKIKKGMEEDNFGFLSGWKVYKGKYVEFRIDSSLKDMLVDIVQNGNFTMYDLECALSLRSTHSIRIYEILKSVEWKGPYVEITLENLRWSLDIEKDQYTDFGNFRRTVLEKAQRDLCERTDMAFTYKTVKEGRGVVAIQFHLNKNPRHQKTVQGALAKKALDCLQPGDKILFNGAEYDIMKGGILAEKGAVPIGQLNQLFKKGKVKRVTQ